MNDIFGKKLNLGDKVVYIDYPSSVTTLEIGIIKKIYKEWNGEEWSGEICELENGSRVSHEPIMLLSKKEDSKECFEDWQIFHQFDLPRRLNSLASRFPEVSWAKANQLYKESVLETLEHFNVDSIIDPSLGVIKGYAYASQIFQDKLKEENNK